jgi:hypothetical protein
MAAHASHPHDVVGRGRKRKCAATNVIGIRHGSPSGGLPGIPFSADEETFIEEAVAFLRRRANADVILDEIWTHAVVSRDEDAEPMLGEDAAAVQGRGDEAAGPGEDALDDDDTAATERNRTAPARARRSPENIPKQSAGADEATPPAIHVVPPRSGKGPPAKDHGSEESTP